MWLFQCFVANDCLIVHEVRDSEHKYINKQKQLQTTIWLQTGSISHFSSIQFRILVCNLTCSIEMLLLQLWALPPGMWDWAPGIQITEYFRIIHLQLMYWMERSDVDGIAVGQ